MCRRISCERCHKPSYAGCGAHIEQVLADVPEAQRCHCREEAQAKRASGAKDPKQKTGWWPF